VFPTSTLPSCIHISLPCFDECFNQVVLLQFECLFTHIIFRNCPRCCICSHNSLPFVVHNLSGQSVTAAPNTSLHSLVLYHIVSAFCSAVRCFIFVRPSVLASVDAKTFFSLFHFSVQKDGWLLAVSTPCRRVTSDFYFKHSLDSLTAITRGGPRLAARNSHLR
jgi:hypothetical protein